MQVITQSDAVTATDVAANAEAAKAALAGFASVDEPGSEVGKAPAKVDMKATPEKTDAEKAADAKAVEEAAAREVAEKEWDGVPAPLRTRVEALTQQLSKVTETANKVGTTQRHVKALEDQITALKSAAEAAKTVAKSGGDAPTQEQIAAAASSDEEWTKLLEDFPDWKEGIDKRIDHRLDARLKKFAPPAVDVAGLKTELTGTVTEIVAKATSEAKAEARALAQIDRRHENWERDIYVDGDRSKNALTPEFTAWEAAQPPEVRALANSDKPQDAIKMLDKFYADRKAVAEATAKAERNKKRLESAITPKGVATAAANRNLTEEEAMLQGFLSVDT